MSPEVTLDGHRHVYTALGSPDAPPLIMIHGWYSHRGVWSLTCETLKDTQYCVAMDLLGFGDSAKPSNADYDIEAYGRRVLQLADVFGYHEFGLVGHSMGGQIALCVASLLAPERITKMVSVAGVVAGRLMPRVERVNWQLTKIGAVLPWLYALGRRLIRWRWFSYAYLRHSFYRMDALPFEDWEIDRRMVFQPGVHITGYMAGQAMHDLDLTPHLEKIKAPTLAIFGQQDGCVPVSDGHLVEQYVPRSRLVLIDHCGHYPMYEQPGQYLEALRRFLLD
jgi:abhydrolase domain-containing protein 6